MGRVAGGAAHAKGDVVTTEDFELGNVLAAAERASPVESVDVVAESLRRRFDASSVSLLFADLLGGAMVRFSPTGAGEAGRSAGRIGLAGSVYEEAMRTQRPVSRPDEATGGQRLVAPVTNRGDAIGVLEMTVPHADETALREISAAAHSVAYIVVTDRRFTDLYTWGQRTVPMSLASEIQYQLLPSALACEAGQFTLAGALVPADDLGGDSFDYSLDGASVQLSITDAMGHDVNAALLATLLVGALRGARRDGADLVGQADRGHHALSHYAEGTMATGQLLRIDLWDGGCTLVNAGHPWPWRLRDGVAEEVRLAVDLPFGTPEPGSYRLQRVDLRPGDRLVMVSDGVQERKAAAVDLPSVLRETRTLHPREMTRAVTNAVIEASDGSPQDDATVLCLDWHGVGRARRGSESGADVGRASPAPVSDEERAGPRGT